jgi:hypothetical protein
MTVSITLKIKKDDVKRDIIYNLIHNDNEISIEYNNVDSDTIKLEGNEKDFWNLTSQLDMQSDISHEYGQYEYKKSNDELSNIISRKLSDK